MSALVQLRVVALLEGISFLFLLLVAMPLKYAAGMPLAVRIAGSVHGLLFLVFVVALYRAALELEWKLSRAAGMFVWSLVPFGFIPLDRMLRPPRERPPAAS